ncbi:hypothetical protein [Pontiella desulfatans]|nr:hypothetical protein [Pontiella desulfatans]
MKQLIPFLAIVILTGCAGPMDYVSPGLQVVGRLNQTNIYATQPYDYRHMKRILDESNTEEENHRPKEPVEISENGEFEINVYGFRRGGLFWILPPLGGIGLDYKAEVIIEVEGQSPRGIVMGKKPETYIYDPEQKKVVRDVSDFIQVVSVSKTERTEPFPWSEDKKEIVDKLTIKIKDFQPVNSHVPVKRGEIY